MKSEQHESRFNIKRLAYTLGTVVQPFRRRDNVPGHYVKVGGADTPSSSLSWTDTTVTARADLPGDVKFSTRPGVTLFTSASGASVTYYPDGSFVYSASPTSPVSERERLRREQASRPWWEKDREAIENEYIYETGRVLADPVYGESKQKGTPYRHFKLTLPVSETDEKVFDIYAYGQALSLVSRRNIHKDDMVRVRASVQFHEQRQSGGRTVAVPWLNLFDIQKVK